MVRDGGAGGVRGVAAAQMHALLGLDIESLVGEHAAAKQAAGGAGGGGGGECRAGLGAGGVDAGDLDVDGGVCRAQRVSGYLLVSGADAS